MGRIEPFGFLVAVSHHDDMGVGSTIGIVVLATFLGFVPEAFHNLLGAFVAKVTQVGIHIVMGMLT
jgi:hypothetical protein